MRPDARSLDDAGPHRVLGQGAIALHLHQERQLLPVGALRDQPDGDGAAGARAGQPVEGVLELLRSMIRAAQDDHLLGATGDDQLARLDESQIAGVEPSVAERLRRSVRVLEVAEWQMAAAGDPTNLHGPLGEKPAASGIEQQRSRPQLERRQTALATTGHPSSR